MNRLLIIGAVVLLVLPVTAWAQSDDSDETPSSWVGAARSRHQLLMQARVTNARQGGFAGTTDGLEEESSSSSSSGGLSSLLDIVSGLSSSVGSSTSGLGSLLGGLTGDTSTTTSGGEEEWTIEDLLALGEAMGGTGKPINQPLNDSSSSNSKLLDTAQEYETREASGSIGRLPKIDATSQSSTDDQKFISRLTERLATTFFTSLAIGFQSSSFINLLKDQLRPIFFSTTDDGEDNTNGGDGIEDQNPPNGNDGTDSIV